jgi:DNA-binding IclR family transcriptional regulator
VTSVGLPTPATSLSRGLGVLLSLEGDTPRTVSELAYELEMPISTLYRFLRELRRFGFVIEPVDGEYTLGPAILDLALGSWLNGYLVRAVQPALTRLMTRHQETALAVVRDGLRARTIAQAEAERPIRFSFRLGTLQSLHAGASATALLAFQPASVINAVIEQGLERFTPGTPGDSAELQAMLAEIRREGIAISNAQVDVGVLAVAAPVFYRGRALSAISLVGPSERCESSVTELSEGVRAEAARVSAELEQWRSEE